MHNTEDFSLAEVLWRNPASVPALQHVGLLLQVLPVNTSCISCSTRWWKIKLSLFSHLHPCFLLLSVAKKKKKNSNKSRVWDCDLLALLGVCKLPRTHLAWMHLSMKYNQHVSPRNSFSWISFSCPISLTAAVVYSLLRVSWRNILVKNPSSIQLISPSGAWPSEGPSHLALFGLWSSKVLMWRAGGRVQHVVLSCLWAVQNLIYISLSDKSNLLLNVCCLSVAIDCFKNLPWHQMIYL